MKMTRIILSITVFTLTSLFLNFSPAAANVLTDSKIRTTVTSLINHKTKVHIQGMGIERDDQGKLSLDIKADLGNCWGKKKIARRFAKDALKDLFASDLPIAYVILKVYESNKILLTVSLGKNQADVMNWDEKESSTSFYNHIKSRMNFEGKPADFCWVIEKGPTGTP